MEINKLLSQVFLDLSLQNSLTTRFGRVVNWFLKKLQYVMTLLGDPLVVYDLFETKIELPISHNLPIFRKSYPNYSTNVGRIAQHVHKKYSSLNFVDIGANIGDTVAILRHYAHYPILCIEGSLEYFGILELNTLQLDNVYRVHTFVGGINDSLRAAFISDRGTARLTTGNANIVVRKLSSILADFPAFENTKMIKVDTDGMDGIILRGAADVIRKARPVIFFEYDPFFLSQHNDNGLSLFLDLKKLGYKTALIYDNFGVYMLSLVLDDSEQLEDLHLYLLGWKGARYYDICVFHEDDADLARIVRENEVSFFTQ